MISRCILLAHAEVQNIFFKSMESVSKSTIHDGVKYSFEYCDYKATQNGYLQQNVKSIHYEVQYSCGNCD